MLIFWEMVDSIIEWDLMFNIFLVVVFKWNKKNLVWLLSINLKIFFLILLLEKGL